MFTSHSKACGEALNEEEDGRFGQGLDEEKGKEEDEKESKEEETEREDGVREEEEAERKGAEGETRVSAWEDGEYEEGVLLGR